MAPREANAFEYDWRYRARPQQLPPAGSWRVWLLMAGRGFGENPWGAGWGRAGGQARRRRSAPGGPAAAGGRKGLGGGGYGSVGSFAAAGRTRFGATKP